MSITTNQQPSFQFNQDGSVAIVFALLATSLFGMVAFAIDMARAHNATARMAAALDAAALAGAKALDNGSSDAEIRATAQAFFTAQFPQGAAGGVNISNFQANIDRSKASVVAVANAKMDTMFGGVVGIKKLTLDRSSAVVYKTRNVELSMAMDITGSMQGTKIVELQAAANEVIDTLFNESQSEQSVRIALVPWSTSVNAGSYASEVTGGASTDNCVIERKGAEAATDAYPSGSAEISAVTTTPFSYYNCTANPIVPLMGRSKKSDLKSSIANYIPLGGTAGHIGTAWGWYMLSPTWASIWPNGSKPNPYNPRDTVKGVLIMTDGEFNTSWSNGPSTDQVAMADESYVQFQQLCTEMKAKDITVFTVGFGSLDARATTELTNCASGPAQTFQASNGTELKKAFKQVATQLKSMRISQ
jgi:Flp pilus assembly protein TadG